MNPKTILLVGHGTRFPGGNAETEAFAARWRIRHPDWRIETCYLEWDAVLLDSGLDHAAAEADEVLVLPLILNAAGHVKQEIPAAVAAARARHPRVHFRIGRHLGVGPVVLGLLQQRLDDLMADLAMPDPRTTGVILLGRGSSDPGANGELARLTRWLYEANDHDLVELAFTAVAWPRLETLVQRQVRLGMLNIGILPVYLFAGRLTERIAAQVEWLRTQYPRIRFGLTRHFGFEAPIHDLLDARVVDAAADRLLDCDGCQYRQWAIGTGHGHGHAHGHAHGHGPGPAHAAVPAHPPEQPHHHPHSPGPGQPGTIAPEAAPHHDHAH
ncbi:MAG: sirohydrochlorin chelatase [Chromatiaceae bacterium]|nr:MAG: sirohydrochlorin chelatase [Chromatiaceae bacterium]